MLVLANKQCNHSICSIIGYFQWGSTKDLLAVNTIAHVFMLNEHVMSANFRDQVCLSTFIILPPHVVGRFICLRASSITTILIEGFSSNLA